MDTRNCVPTKINSYTLYHKKYFIKNIKILNDHQANRPFSKIVFWLVQACYKRSILLSRQEKEALTEVCFDWLITNQKVACEVFAMQSLLLLGKEFNWIHPELKIILEQNIPNKSVGYKSRALKILTKL